MNTQNEILTELQEIAPNLGKEGIPLIPYSLPAGYFEGFPAVLMNLIRVENPGFQEPETGREIAELSALLAGLQDKPTYQAPPGFFESLDIKIPDAVLKAVKLVPMEPLSSRPDSGSQRTRRISLPVRMLRYAAAACITALIGIAVVNLVNHRSIKDPILSLHMISDQDMANYLDADDIHWTPGIATSPGTASVDFNDNDIHELFSSVSDDELEQYFPELPGQKRSVN